LRKTAILLAAMAACLSVPLFPAVAFAENSPAAPPGENGGSHTPGHGDPYAIVFEGLAVVLVAASVGRWAARRLKHSPVLGELLAGIVAGALLYHVGNPAVVILRHADILSKAETTAMSEHVNWEKAVHSALGESGVGGEEAEKIRSVALREDYPKFATLYRSMRLFSSIGVILLLFMVGLESSLEGMRRVAGSALGVASLGVIAPFLLGYLVMFLLLPRGSDPNVPIFVGATFCATSIGITARVFRDTGFLESGEARIVLAAAVLDDILGLIVLAVVTGVVATGAVEVPAVGWILLKAILFLGLVILFGSYLMKRTIRYFTRLDPSHAKLLFPFTLLMLLAWAADAVGLAAIVGAFAAGLILDDEYFADLPVQAGGTVSIESIIAPIEGIFAPVFFVLMGMLVDAGSLADPKILLAGLILTVAAVAGKMVSSLPVKQGTDRLIVGIGMVPRGEVGLIFAGIGKGIGVLDDRMFSVVVTVVLLTTLVTPPLLGWAIRRKERREERTRAI